VKRSARDSKAGNYLPSGVILFLYEPARANIRIKTMKERRNNETEEGLDQEMAAADRLMALMLLLTFSGALLIVGVAAIAGMIT
jgi:hypothetical protein